MMYGNRNTYYDDYDDEDVWTWCTITLLVLLVTFVVVIIVVTACCIALKLSKHQEVDHTPPQRRHSCSAPPPPTPKHCNYDDAYAPYPQRYALRPGYQDTSLNNAQKTKQDGVTKDRSSNKDSRWPFRGARKFLWSNKPGHNTRHSNSMKRSSQQNVSKNDRKRSFQSSATGSKQSISGRKRSNQSVNDHKRPSQLGHRNKRRHSNMSGNNPKLTSTKRNAQKSNKTGNNTQNLEVTGNILQRSCSFEQNVDIPKVNLPNRDISNADLNTQKYGKRYSAYFYTINETETWDGTIRHRHEGIQGRLSNVALNPQKSTRLCDQSDQNSQSCDYKDSQSYDNDLRNFAGLYAKKIVENCWFNFRNATPEDQNVDESLLEARGDFLSVNSQFSSRMQNNSAASDMNEVCQFKENRQPKVSFEMQLRIAHWWSAVFKDGLLGD